MDFVRMMGNLSQSLYPIQHFISGLAYILGILFFGIALFKLHSIAASGRHGSREKPYVPLAYFISGAALLFLPSAINILASSAFGPGNLISYSNYNPYDIYSSMGLLIRTIGLIWFVRGAVLVAHASEPGAQHGTKGMLFMISGIFAIQFDNTIAVINALMDYISHATLTKT